MTELRNQGHRVSQTLEDTSTVSCEQYLTSIDNRWQLSPINMGK